MQTVDLHTHSTASDGQYAPGPLVGRAKEKGVGILALTDHDTIDGLAEARRAGERLGVQVLRGVELSAGEYHNFHILGYGFREGHTPLQELCSRFQQGREEKKLLLLDFLHSKGLDITLEEVEGLAGGKVIGRPHFAQALVRRGYVKTNREAFQRFLDTEEYHQIKIFKLSARTCVEAIKASGGKASLAHPYQLRLEDAALEGLVKKLTAWGLDALECHYPKHTPAQQASYLGLAGKYGLHVTGGSDFHGEKVKPDVQLAPLHLDISWLLEGQA